MKIHPSSSTQRSHLFQFPTDIPLVTPPYSRYRGFIRPMTLVPPVFLTPKKDTSQLSQNSSLLLAEPKKHVDDREADVQPLSTPCYPQSSQTFEAEVSPVTLTEVSPSLLASTPEISTTPVRASSSERLKSPSSLALAEASPPKKVIKLTERPRNHSTPIENGTLKLSKKLTQATITQCFHALGLPKSGDARKKRECSGIVDWRMRLLWLQPLFSFFAGSHLNDLKQVQTGSVFQESVNTNLNSSYDRLTWKYFFLLLYFLCSI